MRALRLLTLAAAMVIPAAAAHAQVSVYVGPAPYHQAYGQTWVPARWGLVSTGRYYVPAQPVWGGYDGWRAHRYWAEHRGYRNYGRRW